LSIAPEARVLRVPSDSATILVAGEEVPRASRLRLERLGAQLLTAPQQNGRIDLSALMAVLGQLPLTSILIEGGGRVIGSALRAGVVDKIVFFYAPKILGGDDGVSICRGPGPALMRESLPVRDIAVYRFGDDVMIEGYPAADRGATTSL
jgi:diaminohydroxyphosphoribosylaminopyrimidine deaminase/5-amino-6-(5-phosphoribosylamino)uracil reductase